MSEHQVVVEPTMFLFMVKEELHLVHIYIHGERGSTVVKVLCYKSEGRWFDPSWCQWSLR